MADRYKEIKENICRYSEVDSAVKAVIAIGSTTRESIKADEYSDLDLIIVTDSPTSWYSGEYPMQLGEISIGFLEPTLGNGKEYRAIYDEDKDVDMIIFTPEQFTEAVKNGTAGWVMNRGYDFLCDKAGFSELVREYVNLSVVSPQISESEFLNLTNDFYFHNIWAAKKLLRGELWSAKICVDGYLKNHLLKMIELYCYQKDGRDIWHDGRFIDRWADDWILEKLGLCFAHYEKSDIRNALFNTHDLFRNLATMIAEKNGFEYPLKAETTAKEYIKGNRENENNQLF